MAAAKAEKGQVYAFRKKVAAVFEGGKTFAALRERKIGLMSLVIVMILHFVSSCPACCSHIYVPAIFDAMVWHGI